MRRHLTLLLLFGWLAALLPAAATADMHRTYAYGSDPRQRLDHYPAAGRAPQQVIVMLHGGGWRIGDKGHSPVWEEKVAHWVPQGVAFVSVNTRLVPQADPLAQAEDLAAAVTYLQTHARALNIDAGNMILMGHSAGAHVAALLATRSDLQRAAGMRPVRGTILLDSGAIDVDGIMANRPPRLYRRAFGDDPAFWQATSPLVHLGAGDGPFLVVCSAQRRAPCPEAQQFAQKGASAGVAVSVLPVPMSHGEINAELGRAAGYTAAVDRWIAALPR